MKDQINLLSPEIQKKRIRRLYFLRVSHIVTIILIAVLVVLLTQSATYFALSIIKNNLDTQSVVANQQVSELENETRDANILLGQILTRIHAYTLWTPRVTEILAIVPKDVFVSSLSVDADKGALTIKAGSVSRVAGVDFQKKLEQLPWVERVDAPLQNFATSPVGTFSSFSFTLSPKQPKL